MKIKIFEIKKIREDLNLIQIVILGIDVEGIQHVATHGKTKTNAKGAAKMGNLLKKYLSWPDDLCHSKPLERICSNCGFFKWTDSRFDPQCYVDPKPIFRESKATACRYFEPNQ